LTHFPGIDIVRRFREYPDRAAGNLRVVEVWRAEKSPALPEFLHRSKQKKQSCATLDIRERYRRVP
jgi:hypothetical protein